jgi:hypothetical protein
LVQLVFVDGLAGLPNAADREPHNRKALLEQVLFDGVPLKIHSPRWQPLLPALQLDPVPIGADGDASVTGQALAGGSLLAQLARRDPRAVFDSAYALLVERADLAGRNLGVDEIASFRAAMDLLADDRTMPAIDSAETDEELIAKLGHVINPDGPSIAEELGAVGGALSARAQASVSALANSLSHSLSPTVSRLLGSTLAYFTDATTRQGVRGKVAHKIKKAAKRAKADNDALVLIGHGLGGVILYDVLSSRTSCGLPKALKVDALVTAGSQVGLIQQCGLFEAPKGATEECVAAWFDLIDSADVLAAAASPGIATPNNVAFNGVGGLLHSHASYFRRPQVHAWLRRRLQELGLV